MVNLLKFWLEEPTFSTLSIDYKYFHEDNEQDMHFRVIHPGVQVLAPHPCPDGQRMMLTNITSQAVGEMLFEFIPRGI